MDGKWNRESWYRRPDGRLDWLGIQGLVLIAILLIGTAAVIVSEAIR